MFVEAADRLADGGQPAVALLGGTINPAWLWGSITEALGLPPLGADQLLDAMEAAAQAANAPFVLLIDALNDSSEPYRWADVLPAFLAAVKRRPWIVVGFSLRKGYEPVVLPESELGDRVAHVEHHGFATRETEAIDRYFDHYRLEPPRVPLLAAEFTNPLFLKLYCQGLKEAGLTAPDLGHQHLTQVFDRWVDGRLRRVTRKLQLRPHVAARALGEFTEALIAAGNDRLDYPNAEALIDRHAAHLNQWPETLMS